MTPKEPTRLQVLNSLLAEHMTLDQAATLLGVSERHTRRILAAYREEGAAARAHGPRGRRAPNATPHALAADVVHLARTRYAGVNHTHLSELLSERERIDIGRSTLRRIPVNAGLSSPRSRRPPQRRVRRQRMPREGMLIQVDGSHHPWLGDQAPPFTLLIAVDDATGAVVDALFCQQEDAHSYFLLIQSLIERLAYPLPATPTGTAYSDTHPAPASLACRPSSAEPWRSWGFRWSSPGPPRGRVVWSARRGPSRTGWSPNSDWQTRAAFWGICKNFTRTYVGHYRQRSALVGHRVARRVQFGSESFRPGPGQAHADSSKVSQNRPSQSRIYSPTSPPDYYCPCPRPRPGQRWTRTHSSNTPEAAPGDRTAEFGPRTNHG